MGQRQIDSDGDIVMSDKISIFIEKNLGLYFAQSLVKSEIWKPATKSVNDIEDMRVGLKIVPRIIMSFLVKELTPMLIGQNKEVGIPGVDGGMLWVTKFERDQYSGQINQHNKKLTDFKFRSIPSLGLVLMSTFELYNLDDFGDREIVQEDVSAKVQKMIDERLALHDLIGQVVDKKIMEKDAVHQLVMRKLTEMMGDQKKIVEVAKLQEESTKGTEDEYFRGMTNGMKVAESIVTKQEPKFIEPPKDTSGPKKRPLHEFLEKAKKKHEYSVVMAKGENVDCPDCRQNIFNGKIFSGCICLGDDMERKVFIKKSEDGIKVRFSKGWDQENIEMLLEVLRKKHG